MRLISWERIASSPEVKKHRVRELRKVLFSVIAVKENYKNAKGENLAYINTNLWSINKEFSTRAVLKDPLPSVHKDNYSL